ncbi:site-2 protease family protein [Streptococcus sp. UBA4344]|uniref:site-2 protease family protein n=1 Tax=Streptococcus sp. UBA4344 TaxID=1947564 RepID=UPI00257EC799|nr:site-2 protease family protein [Streptococcus sp. UBA4344]
MRKLYSPFFLTISGLSFLLLLLPTARKDVMVSYFSIMVANVFHELGHLIVGYLNGIKPSYLIIGFIKFDFENGFRLKFNDNWMYYGGIYRYKVTNYPERAILKLLVGGPLFSLIGSLVLFLKLDILTVFGYCSFLLFLITALPLNFFGLCNDGFKSYKLLVRDNLFLLYQNVSRKLLQEYSDETFDEVSKVCSTLESQNVPDYIINTFLLYLIYAWLLQGEVAQVRNLYQRLTEMEPSNQFNRNYYYCLLVTLESLMYKRMSRDLFAKVNLDKLDKISQKRLRYLSCLYLERGQGISESKLVFQEVLASYNKPNSILVQAEQCFLA